MYYSKPHIKKEIHVQVFQLLAITANRFMKELVGIH